MKIFSLNVWFDDFIKEERTKILIDYIKNNNFDVLCFQEITTYVISKIYKKIEKEYPFIHIDLDEDFYGVCIISKNIMKNKNIYSFKNSKMRRSLIYCEIDNIIISTTHLESEFNKFNNNKIKQFNDSITLLNKFDKVVFISDTNLQKKDCDKIKYDNFIDVYDLGFDKTKYTYDGVDNPLLSNKIRSRIDRAYVKNVEVKNYHVEKEYVMSDHFGIILEIKS